MLELAAEVLKLAADVLELAAGVLVHHQSCYLHNELFLWNVALLVVSVTRQFFYKQAEHKVTTSVPTSTDLFQ